MGPCLPARARSQQAKAAVAYVPGIALLLQLFDRTLHGGQTFVLSLERMNTKREMPMWTSAERDIRDSRSGAGSPRTLVAVIRFMDETGTSPGSVDEASLSFFAVYIGLGPSTSAPNLFPFFFLKTLPPCLG